MDVVDDLTIAARSQVPVLIVGRTAEGRERLARALHQRSPRRRGPWVVLSCAEITAPDGSVPAPHDVLAARLERARHGTLFIDDLAEMSRALQRRLLRYFNEPQHG